MKDFLCILSLLFKMLVYAADDHLYNDKGPNIGDVNDYNYNLLANGNDDSKAQKTCWRCLHDFNYNNENVYGVEFNKVIQFHA